VSAGCKPVPSGHEVRLLYYPPFSVSILSGVLWTITGLAISGLVAAVQLSELDIFYMCTRETLGKLR